MNLDPCNANVNAMVCSALSQSTHNLKYLIKIRVEYKMTYNYYIKDPIIRYNRKTNT